MMNFLFGYTLFRHVRALQFFFALAILTLSSAYAAIPIQSWTTPNGAKVLLVENHSIPVVDVSVEFDAGSRRDPTDKAGLASMANMMLARGIAASSGVGGDEPALSEAQVLDAFADTAAQRGGSVSLDRAGVTLRSLSSQAESDAAILLFARMLAQPSFPADFLARDKARAIAAIKEELTKPDAIASRAFMHALYGGNPYSMQPTPESVEPITRDDVVAFYRKHYVADRAVIAIVGDVSRERAEAIASQLTLRMAASGKAAALPPMPEVLVAGKSEQRIAHPASQSHILIGMPAAVRGDPDFFALMVGNYVLGGGGFVSRLMQEVREKRGLSYGVYSSFSPLLQPGPFRIGLQTQKAQTAEAIAVVRGTVADFLHSGPSKTEMKAAKDYLVQGFALRIDTNSKILDQVAMIGYYNLPLDYLDTWTSRISQVTREDVLSAFNRKIKAGNLITVVVGSPD
jgi:zinc protease